MLFNHSIFMTRYSIELVPRKQAVLLEEAEGIARRFPQIDTVNIPDLVRFKTPSWEACRAVAPHFENQVPHIRAVDFDVDGAEERLLAAVEGFGEVLVVSGDPSPGKMVERASGHCLSVITKLRELRPDLHVYAGLDPYRQGMQDEFEYVRKKMDAGACGLFSQPFFSIDLLRAYRDLLPAEIPIFWGLSPVRSEKSKAYWIDINQALFPRDFAFTVAGNQAVAREIVEEVKANDDHLYFMPIRMDALEYLAGIFD